MVGDWQRSGSVVIGLLRPAQRLDRRIIILQAVRRLDPLLWELRWSGRGVPKAFVSWDSFRIWSHFGAPLVLEFVPNCSLAHLAL